MFTLYTAVALAGSIALLSLLLLLLVALVAARLPSAAQRSVRRQANAAVAAAAVAAAAAAAATSTSTSEVAGKDNGTGKTASAVIVAFFHPYCDAGGGGERVLWCAIRAVLSTNPRAFCVVLTGDASALDPSSSNTTPRSKTNSTLPSTSTTDTPGTATSALPPLDLPLHRGAAILQRAEQRFGTVLPAARIGFVHLQHRDAVEAARYPRLTMLLQSLGSLLLGWEALRSVRPDIFLDTMGYAFVLPLFARLAGCARVGCYVHYPTISTDMLAKVAARRADYNNTGTVSRSPLLSRVKLVYYRLFAWAYGLAGASASVVMVNSSWTRAHIASLWRGSGKNAPVVVYPPCDTEGLRELPLQGSRQPVVVSVAQFRPEKNHALQLHALACLFATHPEWRGEVSLVMIGGCRNEGDRARVTALETLCQELDLVLGTDVQIFTNISYDALKNWLAKATIGLHTMTDEHFGIGVVEFLAAGTIALAHDSAGPQQDIIVPYEGQRTGFLATTAEDYAEAMHTIFRMSPEARISIQTRARASVVKRFSEDAFESKFLECLAPLLRDL